MDPARLSCCACPFPGKKGDDGLAAYVGMTIPGGLWTDEEREDSEPECVRPGALLGGNPALGGGDA